MIDHQCSLINHQGSFPFLVSLGKVCSAEDGHDITRMQDPSLYVSFQEEILLKPLEADVLPRKEHKSVALNANASYRQQEPSLKTSTSGTCSRTERTFRTLQKLLTKNVSKQN